METNLNALKDRLVFEYPLLFEKQNKNDAIEQLFRRGEKVLFKLHFKKPRTFFKLSTAPTSKITVRFNFSESNHRKFA